MQLVAPEKKRHYYLSQLYGKKGKKIYINIEGVKLISIAAAQKATGYLVHVWIGADSDERTEIEKIDKFVYDEVCDKHLSWFKTDISQDKLSEYFRACIDANNVCCIFVSDIITPSVMIDGLSIDDFADVCSMPLRELRGYHCSCKLEVEGVRFYPKTFGIRLLLRSIKLSSVQPSSIASDQYVAPDKVEVEEAWESELEELQSSLEEDEQKLAGKIQRLREFKQNMRSLIADAKQEVLCSEEWNNKLNELATSIFKYKTGRLL